MNSSSTDKKRKIDIDSTEPHLKEALNFIDNKFIKVLLDQATLPVLQPATGKQLCQV
jgi:hypothetical protein